jgi:hypothetical protein
MDNKFAVSVLAAAAIYVLIAAVLGAGIKTIATQVPKEDLDTQFAPVVCSLAVSCSYPERLKSERLFDNSSLHDDLGIRRGIDSCLIGSYSPTRITPCSDSDASSLAERPNWLKIACVCCPRAGAG